MDRILLSSGLSFSIQHAPVRIAIFTRVRTNSVKQALKEGRVQLGCSCYQLRSPDVVRALAAAGLDWVFFDAEHGPFGLETLQDLMRVANGVGLCPIVRVADLQYSLIARALDCGAQGVLLPRVESPELLDKAVSWTRFPPMGTRGFGLGPPHLDYEAVSIADAVAHVNAHVLVVLQIETRTALERIDELLAVSNVDAVLIGPGDLSISLGIPGQFDDPRFVAAVETIRDRCDRAGVAPGMHMRSLELGRKWRGRGLRLVSCNSDLGFLLDKATEMVTALKG
jgi:2-keto-3-deoxy-L-rhamnonate aldolase RhmA